MSSGFFCLFVFFFLPHIKKKKISQMQARLSVRSWELSVHLIQQGQIDFILQASGSFGRRFLPKRVVLRTILSLAPGPGGKSAVGPQCYLLWKLPFGGTRGNKRSPPSSGEPVTMSNNFPEILPSHLYRMHFPKQESCSPQSLVLCLLTCGPLVQGVE